ncbi:hypothetical protein LDENG_00234410 [Lucifuga dentata]|nr:hypothetical protein LDENG_00234410 [Lucifuga dentata]
MNITFSVDSYQSSWFSPQTTPRADVWWYCGGKTLYNLLPLGWHGTCAPVQLLIPLSLLPISPSDLLKSSKSFHRSKCSTAPLGSFDKHIYIDAIGVPRGVPNEFKARNQILAGLESLFFWWSTLNKNVDWINYLYYNQQRFINYTRDGFKGVSEQLDATSRMTWQNRMALDMLLAEKGGVCAMFGDSCCTYIPNNTAPDGSITRAIAGLTSLSHELAENSGIDDPFTSVLDSWFGKWSGFIKSAMIAIAIAAAILIILGCCCIPCVRSLLQHLIDTAITKQCLQYQPLPLSDFPDSSILDDTLDRELPFANV